MPKEVGAEKDPVMPESVDWQLTIGLNRIKVFLTSNLPAIRAAHNQRSTERTPGQQVESGNAALRI